MEKKLWGIWQQPFFDDFDECKNILLAGCGGGYDFLNTVPLYFALKYRAEKLGKSTNIYISNQSFSALHNVEGRKIGPACVEVTSDTIRKPTHRGKTIVEWSIDKEDYFPELFLAKWFLLSENLHVPIYTFESSGVAPIRQSYKTLINELKIDCIILVDGGTDSLMRGNEIELGTPTEDMTSIAAVSSLEVPNKYLVCIGMGVDSFHGVKHNLFLENVADLSKEGAYLGSFSLIHTYMEAAKFEAAYLACQPECSIVCSSVLSAVKGEFGNYHSPYTKHRTAASKLFISPLMSLYWCFKLAPLADKVIYLDKIMNTATMAETSKVVHSFHSSLKNKRQGAPIPY